MGFITKHDHGKKPENKYKNRFVNIIACKYWKYSRIFLFHIGADETMENT